MSWWWPPRSRIHPSRCPGPDAPTGFDVELTDAIGAELDLSVRHVRYDGADFNGIFEGLAQGTCDCVASGTTITAARERVASFCAPYFSSGQSLVCNMTRTPNVTSVDDLSGLVVGVQDGNTSQPVAEALKEKGKIAAVRVYAYDDIKVMLDDVESGTIAAAMKLAPVMHWFTKDRPALQVVQEGITKEQLGIAVKLGDEQLRAAIEGAQNQLRARGTLDRLVTKWLAP